MNTKTAASTSRCPIEAVTEIHQQIGQDDSQLVIIYCSSDYDLSALAATINSLFQDTLVIGCTTAGEIGPNGIQQNGIVGISIKSDDFHLTTSLITDLQTFSSEENIPRCHELLSTLKNKAPNFNKHNTFFLTLIDGVSKKEEHILTSIHLADLDIPLVGGSAGDNTLFEQTYVFYNGEFHADAAILALIHTNIPFTFIKENAYKDTGKQLVVTAVNEDMRTIQEFNGDNSADVYADLIGESADKLDFSITSNNPVAIKFDNELYIRTIIVRDGDPILTELPYCCNVEEGMVFRLAEPLDTVSSFQQKMNDITDEIGDISIILGFDCVCRRLIYEQHSTLNQLSNMMQDNHVFGFHTYGEQFLRTHINQTFTGIAFGQRA